MRPDEAVLAGWFAVANRSGGSRRGAERGGGRFVVPLIT